MKKNDLFTIEITDVGIDGEGIGKCDGMTWFVKDALIGDEITAKAIKVKKNYGYARLMEILRPSKDRVTPPCPVHRQCGGCSLQALSYEKQLEWKQRKVENNLQRIGGFSEELLREVMQPIIGMDDPYRYRNKAQYPIGEDREGNPVAGFYAARTHAVIPVTDCLLGQEVNAQILDLILGWMKENDVRPYDEKTGTGLVRHVLIRTGFSSKEIMVCLIINGKNLDDMSAKHKPSLQKSGSSRETAQNKLISALSKVHGMRSISVNINTENTNVILGKQTQTIWGESFITDVIGSVCFEISPQSFFQVNPVQTQALYGKALEYAGLSGKETVWDLYCGIGTISLFLAQNAKHVFGVEIVPQAVEDAKRNAMRNHITNATFFTGKAEEVYPVYVKEHPEEGRAEVIVVDPPRKGCAVELLEMICRMEPERVVYVSCDSATLARDLKYLCENGYECKRVQPVDQFCHTGHVETVVLMSRKDK